MIVSPVSVGNGAFVVHSCLAKHLPDYHVIPYSPWRSLFPPSYYPLGRKFSAKVIHAIADSAVFHVRKDVPLVLTLHGYAIDKALYPYSSVVQKIHGRTDLRWLHQLAVRQADVITTVSHFTANLARRDLGIEKPIQVIYNGVDEQRFIPSRHVAGKEIKVLFSGNLTRRKGAHWLLPMIQRLDERIVIYYTSGLREKSELVAHPRLRPLGRISHEEMPAVYQAMDILLLPTVREGHSVAVLEAMASGLPVVASDVASLPEQIVDGQGGFLCPLGNVDAFVMAIEQLAQSVALRRVMGDFNRSTVEDRFRLSMMVQHYAMLFEELAN